MRFSSCCLPTTQIYQILFCLPITKIYQILVSILWSSLNPTTQPIVVSFPLSTTGVRLGLPESIIPSQESDLS